MSVQYLWRQRWLSGLETEYAWWALPNGQGVHQDLKDRVRQLPGGPELEEVDWAALRERNTFTAEDAQTVLDRVRATYTKLFQAEMVLRWDVTSWDDHSSGPTLRYARRFSRRPEKFPQTGTGVQFDYPLVVTSRAPHEDLIGKTVLSATDGHADIYDAFGSLYNMEAADQRVAFGAAFCPLTDRWAGKVEGDIWALDDLDAPAGRYVPKDNTSYYVDRRAQYPVLGGPARTSVSFRHGNQGAAPLFAPAPRLYRDSWLGGNKDSIRDPAIARRFLGRVDQETTWVFQEVVPQRLTALVETFNPTGFYYSVIREIRPVHHDMELYLEIGTGTPDFFKVKSGVRVDLTAYAQEYPLNQVVWHDNGTAEVLVSHTDPWPNAPFPGLVVPGDTAKDPSTMRWLSGLVFQDGRVFLVLPVKQPATSDQWVRWHTYPAWYRPGTGTPGASHEASGPYQDQQNPPGSPGNWTTPLNKYPVGAWSNLPGDAGQDTHIHDILGDFYWRDQKGLMVRVPSPLARDGIYDRLALRCSPNLTTNPARLIYHEALPMAVKVIQESGDGTPGYQVDWNYPEGQVTSYMAPLAAYLALLDGQHDHATDLALSGYADSAGFIVQDGYTVVVDRLALTRGEDLVASQTVRYKYRRPDGAQGFQVGLAQPLLLPSTRYAATGDQQRLVGCTASGLVSAREWGNDGAQPPNTGAYWDNQSSNREGRWVGPHLYLGVFSGAEALRLPNQAIVPFDVARKPYLDVPPGTQLSDDRYYVSSYDVPAWSLGWGTIYPAGAAEFRQQVLALGAPGTLTLSGTVYGISYEDVNRPAVYSGGLAGAGALTLHSVYPDPCSGLPPVYLYSGTPYHTYTERGAVARPTRVQVLRPPTIQYGAQLGGGSNEFVQQLFPSNCAPGRFSDSYVEDDWALPSQQEPTRYRTDFSQPLDLAGVFRGYRGGEPYDKDGWGFSSADTLPGLGALNLLVLPETPGGARQYQADYTQGVVHYTAGGPVYNGTEASYFSGRGFSIPVAATVTLPLKEYTVVPVRPTGVSCLVPRQPAAGGYRWSTQAPSLSINLSGGAAGPYVAAQTGAGACTSYKSSAQVTWLATWKDYQVKLTQSGGWTTDLSCLDGLGQCYPISGGFYNRMSHLRAQATVSYQITYTGKLDTLGNVLAVTPTIPPRVGLGGDQLAYQSSQDLGVTLRAGLQALDLFGLQGLPDAPSIEIQTTSDDGGVTQWGGSSPTPAPPAHPDLADDQGGYRTATLLTHVLVAASAQAGGRLIPSGARGQGLAAVPKSVRVEGQNDVKYINTTEESGPAECGYFGGYTAITGTRVYKLVDYQVPNAGNFELFTQEVQYETIYGADETQPDTFPQPEHPLLTTYQGTWSYPPSRVVDVFAYDWLGDDTLSPARFVGANTPYRVNHVSTLSPKVYHLTGQVPSYGAGQVTYPAPGQSSLVVIDPETLLPGRLDLLVVPLQGDPEIFLRFWQFLGGYAAESLTLVGPGFPEYNSSPIPPANRPRYLEIARPFRPLFGGGGVTNAGGSLGWPDWRPTGGSADKAFGVAYRWRYFNQGAAYLNWITDRLKDGTLQLEITCASRVVAGVPNPPLVFPLDPAALVATTLYISSSLGGAGARVDLNAASWPTQVDEEVGRLGYEASSQRLVKYGEAGVVSPGDFYHGDQFVRNQAARVHLTDPVEDQLAYRVPLSSLGVKGTVTVRLFIPSCQATLWSQSIDMGNT